MYKDPTNQDRAEWAKTALEFFASTTRMKNEAEETILGDLLCDFMHLCSAIGVDFASALNSGRMHFEAEVEEAGDELPAWFHSSASAEEAAIQRDANQAEINSESRGYKQPDYGNRDIQYALSAARDAGYSVHLDEAKGTYAYCIDGDYSDEFESEAAAWAAAIAVHQGAKSVTFNDAIIEAKDLADDGKNVEYTRGVCELLARCFPVMYEPTDERAENIRFMVLKSD